MTKNKELAIEFTPDEQATLNYHIPKNVQRSLIEQMGAESAQEFMKELVVSLKETMHEFTVSKDHFEMMKKTDPKIYEHIMIMLDSEGVTDYVPSQSRKSKSH